MEHKKTVSFEIRIVFNLIRREIERVFSQKYGDHITGMHSWFLGYLYFNRDKDIFQKDIEEEFSIRRSTATEILKLMEKKNLITREHVAYDARLKKIILTEKAIEMQKLICQDIKEIDASIKEGISEEELKIFYNILDKFKFNIEQNLD